MKLLIRDKEPVPNSQFAGKVRVRVEGLDQYSRPMRGAKSFTIGQTTIPEVYELLKKTITEKENE